MRLIHAACKRGVAAVVVTHDAQLASWADRVVFLRDGRVTDQTAPARRPGVAARPGAGPVSTVMTKPRPHAAGTANGGVPARRAVIHWSWRLFRREWRQQLLVLALIVVAVGRHRGRRGGGRQHPARGQRRLRHGPRPRHLHLARPEAGRRHRRPAGQVRPPRRDREPGPHHPRLDPELRPARPEPGRPVRPADAVPAQRALPGRGGPGGADPRAGRRPGPQGRGHLPSGRPGAHRDRHRAEPAEPAG